MRKNMNYEKNGYKVLCVDDDNGILDSLNVFLNHNGYEFYSTTDPIEAIHMATEQHYDLLILDYIMTPIHGDRVVEEIRKVDPDIYILLLTGHKDLAPPIETIKLLDIQGYCEKSDRFDQLLLLIESGVKSIEQMKTIRKYKDGLNEIIKSLNKIYQLQPIDDILKEILKQLLPIVNSSNAFIIVDDVENISSSKAYFYKGLGKYDIADNGNLYSTISTDILTAIGCARNQKQYINMSDGTVFPLIDASLRVIGAIYVETQNFEDNFHLIEIFSTQAASSITNAFLHCLIVQQKDQISQTYSKLTNSYHDTIEALRATVEAKDEYTKGHSDRVAYYSKMLGECFNLNAEDLETLYTAGIFHDIGKIGISDTVLLKNASLNNNEFDQIKKHPIIGSHILSALSTFKNINQLVRHHHEKIDGSGYPDGLSGDNLNLLTKIISVADAFDAMSSTRQYRKSLSLPYIRQEFIDKSGKQFDKEVVEKLLYCLDNNLEKIQKDLNHQFVLE